MGRQEGADLWYRGGERGCKIVVIKGGCAKIQSYAHVFWGKSEIFQKFLVLILQGLRGFLILVLRENSAQMRTLL